MEQRQGMLASVLKPEARERRAIRSLLRVQLPEIELQVASHPSLAAISTAVARIALVKPDKARGVENMILGMAQRGQITEKARRRPLPPDAAPQPARISASSA